MCGRVYDRAALAFFKDKAVLNVSAGDFRSKHHPLVTPAFYHHTT